MRQSKIWSINSKMQKIVKYINDVRRDFKQAIFYLNLKEDSGSNDYTSLLDFAIYICLNIHELNLIERILTNKDPFTPGTEEDLAEDSLTN